MDQAALSDPTRCPGCGTLVNNLALSTGGRFHCAACFQWELDTGLLLVPIAAEGVPPEPIRCHTPSWRYRPVPIPHRLQEQAPRPTMSGTEGERHESRPD